MKAKFSSVIVATLALSLSAGCVEQAYAAPLNAGGQQYKLAQGHAQNRLGLTDDQKVKIKQIHDDAQQQILSVLTDSQKTQMQNAGSDRKARHQAWTSLNLTQEQKNQIHQIKQQAEQNIYNNVYTDAQRQQVDTWRQQRRSQQPQQ